MEDASVAWRIDWLKTFELHLRVHVVFLIIFIYFLARDKS